VSQALTSELFGRAAGVAAGGGGHHVGADSPDLVPEPAWRHLFAEDLAHSAQTDEAQDSRMQPADDQLQAARAGAILFAADLGCGRGHSFDDVAEADTAGQRRVRISFAFEQAGSRGCRPEAIARSAEGDAGLRGVGRRVETADEKAQAGADIVRQGWLANRLGDGFARSPSLQRVDAKSASLQQRLEQRELDRLRDAATKAGAVVEGSVRRQEAAGQVGQMSGNDQIFCARGQCFDPW